MKIDEFKKKFPDDLEGYKIGKIRINDISDEVVGFVLIDPQGQKSYIFYIGDDAHIENYW